MPSKVLKKITRGGGIRTSSPAPEMPKQCCSGLDPYADRLKEIRAPSLFGPYLQEARAIATGPFQRPVSTFWNAYAGRTTTTSALQRWALEPNPDRRFWRTIYVTRFVGFSDSWGSIGFRLMAVCYQKNGFKK